MGEGVPVAGIDPLPDGWTCVDRPAGGVVAGISVLPVSSSVDCVAGGVVEGLALAVLLPVVSSVDGLAEIEVDDGISTEVLGSADTVSFVGSAELLVSTVGVAEAEGLKQERYEVVVTGNSVPL